MGFNLILILKAWFDNFTIQSTLPVLIESKKNEINKV